MTNLGLLGRAIARRLCLVIGLGGWACGGTDDFPAPDAGTAADDSQTSEKPLDERVVEVCSALCEQRVNRGCDALDATLSQCQGVCTFFGGLADDCQAAIDKAYQCQLDNNPCDTKPCDELLRAAEAACPDWQPFIPD